MAKTPYNKFKAKRTVYDGFSFHSKKEAGYAKTLDLLKKSFKPSEKVLSYRKQVPFPIVVNEKKICTYLLDFLVTYVDGRIEHIDVKGYRKGTAYEVFKIKKKLVECLYNITVIEK